VIDYWLVFVTGLLSSLHCIGMCGPIVLAYSLSAGAGTATAARGGIFRLHAAYNCGRILACVILGTVAGLVGMAFSSIRTAGEYVSLVGGAIMIVGGILLLGMIPLPAALTKGSAVKGPARLFGSLLKSPTILSKLALGLLTPLLPCGILYAVVVKAAATQHAGYGALTMLLFAVGMAPALIAVGSLSSLFSARIRRSAEKLAAVTIILLGIILLMRGLGISYLSWLTGGGGSCCQ
jgi:uncharacterized protein